MKAKYIFTIFIFGVRFQSDPIEKETAEVLRNVFLAFRIPVSELEVE